jgi:hypothetical protein
MNQQHKSITAILCLLALLVIASKASASNISWVGDSYSHNYSISENGGEFYWGVSYMSPTSNPAAFKGTINEVPAFGPNSVTTSTVEDFIAIPGSVVMEAKAGGTKTNNGVAVFGHTGVAYNGLTFDYLGHGLNVEQSLLSTFTRQFDVDGNSSETLLTSLEGWVPDSFLESPTFSAQAGKATYSLTTRVIVEEIRNGERVGSLQYVNEVTPDNLNIAEVLDLKDTSRSNDYYLFTASLLINTDINNYDFQNYTSVPLLDPNSNYEIGAANAPLTLRAEFLNDDPTSPIPVPGAWMVLVCGLAVITRFGHIIKIN